MRDHKTLAVLLAAFVAGLVFGADARSEASQSTLTAIRWESKTFIPVEDQAPTYAKSEEWSRIVLSADGEGTVFGEDEEPLAALWFAPVAETP